MDTITGAKILSFRFSRTTGSESILVGLPCNLLDHLNQGTGEGHAWETLLASMDSGSRMTAKTCDERQVQAELVHQPLSVGPAVFAQHLGKFGFLCATIQCQK